ncbi:SDR family oxidoreductase [Candidatus Nitronereus thalassa]|uniref:SDR family oxidoreductase n=1 Tax=Candidatus Nitronereus thalassa TaxID=3020898 RepID=A0ABU3K3Q2_9BACT|nr:SDR family oxidoreductase [Candidatus Nitronereus thalassa]MDT7040989.1 SDR family oxidoreductase [Candidatus Nitronereus thalassa]
MKILILGATSAIAHETAKLFASDGAEFFLVARNKEKLDVVAADLLVRGARRAEEFPMDLNLFELHQQLIDIANANLSEIDIVLIAHGTLSDQNECQNNTPALIKEFNTNCLSTLSLLTHLANYFEQRRKGCIAVISSVAGDRGRQSNYIYGTGKGAVTLFLQGLRNRLAPFGVSVVTIKPGFVDTPMTAHLKKNGLFASPARIGNQIYQAILKNKNVVYTPGFWWPIMTIIKLIPENIFKKLKL